MSENDKIGDLKESFKQYVNTNFELKKLEAIEAGSVIEARMISKFLVGLAIILFVFFSSFCLGFYLSFRLGDYYTGFAIIAGFYFFLSLFLLLVRKKLIEKPLLDSIIRKLFKS